jgi:Spy/CpxP family protein refolding chaperone
MAHGRKELVASALVALLLTAGVASAQTPTPPPAGRGQRPAGPGRAGRAGLPPITANMKPAELQGYIDAWEMWQAKEVLKLTDEQELNFVGRLQRIQAIRRKQMQEHRRLMAEMVQLLNANPAAKPEDIDAHVKALADARETEAADLKKAYFDLDSVLTPWQRGKFRQFEDRVEQRKIELLGLIKGEGGASPAPAPANPGRGRR